ncbi:hypothetical protein QR680_008728 [Steinernema hermaphroditum]|uniref:Uncharacterized protein n=1 Tax=Steinernema hermaphroditum TaxID=289476 RepID=A0AA39IHQ7_9BILA|nr:hypothetical protein QR680_008728 [Steinernema hermaphroditum]
MGSGDGCEYNFDDIFGIVTPVVNLALIAFILYISYRVKSSDISRVYTVFLFVSYVPAEIAGLYYAVLACTGGISREKVYFPEGINWVFFTYKLQRSFAQSQYELLALVMAFISYSLFASPARFNYYFGDGRVKHYFVGVTCLSILFTVSGVLISIMDDEQFRGGTRVFVLTIYTLLQLAIIVPFILMVILYLLSTKAMWEYSRVRTHARSEKDRRNQLLSVLMYCTPPNLLNILVVVISGFQLHKALTGTEYPPFLSNLRTVQWYSEKIRLALLTASTLVAFRHYRDYAFRMFMRKPKANVLFINVSSVQTNYNSSNMRIR